VSAAPGWGGHLLDVTMRRRRRRRMRGMIMAMVCIDSDWG
jgi:hypothetical protein